MLEGTSLFARKRATYLVDRRNHVCTVFRVDELELGERPLRDDAANRRAENSLLSVFEGDRSGVGVPYR